MRYWCKYVNDADVASELCRVYLQKDSYALCELYELDIEEVIKEALK